MKFSEKILLEEIAKEGGEALQAARGLSPGALMKMVRKQIGMSQSVLAKKAGVPQSTISRIEKDVVDPGLATLRSIFQVLECDLVVVPALRKSVDAIRRKQARKVAEAKVGYLAGTMRLEEQEPDPRFTEALLKEEEERLLRGPNSVLWQED